MSRHNKNTGQTIHSRNDMRPIILLVLLSKGYGFRLPQAFLRRESLVQCRASESRASHEPARLVETRWTSTSLMMTTSFALVSLALCGVHRRYYLLRHGQTDMNANGIIQGSSDRSRYPRCPHATTCHVCEVSGVGVSA